MLWHGRLHGGEFARQRADMAESSVWNHWFAGLLSCRIGTISGGPAGTPAAGDHIAETIGPILADIAERFRVGQQVALDQASTFGNQAVKIGSKVGADAAETISDQAKQRPLVMLAVALGVGSLLGAAARRS